MACLRLDKIHHLKFYRQELVFTRSRIEEIRRITEKRCRNKIAQPRYVRPGSPLKFHSAVNHMQSALNEKSLAAWQRIVINAGSHELYD